MRVVYTALIGAYERLNEQPAAAGSALPFICFTDDPTLVSDSWQIELVEPAFAADPVRSSRRLKILGHPALGDFDETLWIDNSVVLEAAPEEILDDWLSGHDLALPQHSFRDTLMDEFEVVAQGRLDDVARIYEQLQHYADVAPELLGRPPLWTALLARRATPAVAAFSALWYEHVLRYSRRDQLSVLMALALSPEVSRRSITLDNHGSRLHRWPVKAGRTPTDAKCSEEDVEPLALQVHTLQRTLHELEAQAAVDAGERRRLAEDLVRAAATNDALADERDALRTRVEVMEASRTWRAGRVAARVFGPAVRALERPRHP